MTVADNRGRVHGRRPGPVEIRARGKRMERGTARAEADEPRRRGHSVEGIESLKRVRRAEERAYGPYRPRRLSSRPGCRVRPRLRDK